MKNYETLLAENRAWAEELFAKIDRKMLAMTKRSRDIVPDGVDKNGRHINMFPNNKSWWCNGFWAGTNLLLWNYTKNDEYLKTAEKSEELMDDALLLIDELHHDVGFMWHIMSGAHYRLTGDKKSRVRNFYAASLLSSRFVLNGNFIRAWNGSWGNCSNYNWSIIDCLMNIPLLYWASDETGDDRYRRVAMAHADMALRDHLRPDGSVNHIVEHDRDTGTVVRTHGGQGFAVGSSWSRGCAWAVYGFVLSYLHTKEERYLTGAKQAANYFIANVSDDWLPRCDFRAPQEPVIYDSSAGAITACGLIELAKVLPEDEGGMYIHAAIRMLRAMGEKFLNLDPENDHLLDYGTGRYPVNGMTNEKAGVHKSLIYADFFYIEAILKLLGSDFNPW